MAASPSAAAQDMEDPQTPRSGNGLFETTEFNGSAAEAGPQGIDMTQLTRLMQSPEMQKLMSAQVAESLSAAQLKHDEEKKQLEEEKKKLEEEKKQLQEQSMPKKKSKSNTRLNPNKKKAKRGKNAYSPREAQLQQNDVINDIGAGDVVAATSPDAPADVVEDATPATPWFDNAREVRVKRGASGFELTASGGVDLNAIPTVSAGPSVGYADGELTEGGEILLKVDGSLVVHLLAEQLGELFEGGDAEEITLLVSHVDDVPALKDVVRDGKAAGASASALFGEAWKAIATRVRNISTPYTTRAPREGEMNGREYNFVTTEKFERMINEGAFLEWGQPPNGAYYGTAVVSEPQPQEIAVARHKSMVEALLPTEGEATVGHVLAGHDPSGDHIKKIQEQVAGVEGMSVSQFLKSVPEDDAEVAAARQRVKFAYYNLTVPYTTRPPREGEKDGRDYNFVSRAEFQTLMEQGKMLEFGVNDNHLYGTAKLDGQDARPDSPNRTEQPTRTAMLQATTVSRADDATVGDLISISGVDKTKEADAVASKSITEFLKSTNPHDPVFGPLRKAVKGWVQAFTTPYTTRPRRVTEIEGREYFFVTPELFEELQDAEVFLEVRDEGPYKLGTPRVTKSHVKHAALHSENSRDVVLAGAKKRRQSHMKVDTLLKAVSTFSGLDDLSLDGTPVGEHTVTELLASSDADHPELKEVRSEILKAVHKVMVPHTTRPPREGELEGQDYHFVSRKEFQDMLQEDMFTDHGKHNGFLYGTKVPDDGDLAAFTTRKSAAFKRMSIDSALVGTDVQPELSVGHFENLVEGGVSGVDPKMPISKFFHHVDEGHADLGELRNKIKAQIMDMTVPYTSRMPRGGEADGKDYCFVSKEEFEELVNEHFFFEYGIHKGVYYGTPRVTISDLDESKPKVSRVGDLQARMDKAREEGELTVGYLLDNKKSLEAYPQLESARDVPLSVFLARAQRVPENVTACYAVKQAVYDMSTPITTRPPRPGEGLGVHYDFISDEEFDRRVRAGDMLDHGGKPNGYKYGTGRLMQGDLKPRRETLIAFNEMQEAKHATLKQILRPEVLEKLHESLHDKTVGQLFRATSHDEPRHRELRGAVKQVVYACTTPWTTRPPRETEEQDVHYHFCSEEEFQTALKEHVFLEWGEAGGYYYGTVHPTKEDVGDDGFLKSAKKRQSMAAALQSSEDREGELTAQLDASVLEAQGGPAATDAKTTTELEEELKAHKAEIADHKVQLEKMKTDLDRVQQDRDLREKDLETLRESVKMLNTALAQAQALVTLTPERIQSLVSSGATGRADTSVAAAAGTTVAAPAEPGASRGPAAAPGVPSLASMTSLKTKMRARRFASKSMAYIAESEDKGTMSPIKKRLRERRLAKESENSKAASKPDESEA
mmetsp:Transcript_9269/g.23806  ORF Transcript_9269/g.23806 Transcript_9269/m.23806 type:complete len:1399 (+) Transcript_9269:36-4232(+)